MGFDRPELLAAAGYGGGDVLAIPIARKDNFSVFGTASTTYTFNDRVAFYNPTGLFPESDLQIGVRIFLRPGSTDDMAFRVTSAQAGGGSATTLIERTGISSNQELWTGFESCNPGTDDSRLVINIKNDGAGNDTVEERGYTVFMGEQL